MLSGDLRRFSRRWSELASSRSAWSSSWTATPPRTCWPPSTTLIGNTQAAADLRAWRRRPAARQARARRPGAGRRGRRDLDGLHRRKRRGRSAESQMAGPGPSLGLRHPGDGPADRLPRLPDDRDDHHQLHGPDGRRSACELQAAHLTTVSRHHPQQHHLAHRGHGRHRAARAPVRGTVRSCEARVPGQDIRLPAAGDLVRRRIGDLALHVRMEARGYSPRSARSTLSGRHWAWIRSAGCSSSRSTPSR